MDPADNNIKIKIKNIIQSLIVGNESEAETLVLAALWQEKEDFGRSYRD